MTVPNHSPLARRLAIGAGLLLGARALCAAETAAPTADPATSTAPKGSLFDSLKQAFTQDLNREVVRGHFDVGTPPDTHRFYCLVDIRTGKHEEYAVGGDTFTRPDGMTGLQPGSAVSPNSCSAAEAQGRLVSSGYVLKLGPKAQVQPSAAPAAAADAAPAAAVAAAVPAPAEVEARSPGLPDRIDVSGIHLGMSPEQVRAALKTRFLAHYGEAAGSLEAEGPPGTAPGQRFVNEIAAWSRTSTGAESYVVMFTPVPGRERALAIIHSMTYPPGGGLSMTALQSALLKKYRGYAQASEVPMAATWRQRGDGPLEVGEGCDGRALLTGLPQADPALEHENLSLKTSAQEFRQQIQQCGIAMITVQAAAPGGAAPDTARTVDQMTIAAYSPAIGLEGASAASQIIQAASPASTRSGGSRRETVVPAL